MSTDIEASDALRTTDALNELAAALAKAQASFPVIEKTRTATINSAKGSYSYTYADLSDIFRALRDPLSKNGLSVAQVINSTILQTVLMHTSGQRIVSYSILTCAAADPKVSGAELTYRRRQALCAILGIAAEDDTDGDGTDDDQRPQERPQQIRPPASKSARAPAAAPAHAAAPAAKADTGELASEGERKYLSNRAGTGLADLLRDVGAASLEALTKAQFLDAKARLVRAA